MDKLITLKKRQEDIGEESVQYNILMIEIYS